MTTITTQQQIAQVMSALAPLMKKWEKARSDAQEFDLKHQGLLPVIYNRSLRFYQGLCFDQERIVQESEDLHMAADEISREYQVRYEQALGWEDSGRTACGQDWNPRTIKVGRIRIPALRACELYEWERQAARASGLVR